MLPYARDERVVETETLLCVAPGILEISGIDLALWRLDEYESFYEHVQC